MWADFNDLRPKLLGAIYYVLSNGLAEIDSTTLDKHPRMADFALLIAACESVLQWEKGTFADVYGHNRDEAQRGTLDGSPAALAALDYHRKFGDCDVTLKDLRLALSGSVTEDTTRRKSWPKDERNLRIILERHRDALRLAGLNITFLGHTHRGSMVALRAVGETSSPPSPPSQGPPNGRFSGDGNGEGQQAAALDHHQRTTGDEGHGAAVTVTNGDAHAWNTLNGAVRDGRDAGEGQAPALLDDALLALVGPLHRERPDWPAARVARDVHRSPQDVMRAFEVLDATDPERGWPL